MARPLDRDESEGRIDHAFRLNMKAQKYFRILYCMQISSECNSYLLALGVDGSRTSAWIEPAGANRPDGADSMFHSLLSEFVVELQAVTVCGEFGAS